MSRSGLHTETLGSGVDVVLVHGWAMHSGIWGEFAECLAERYRVTLVDLPGHGRSAMIEDYRLEVLVDALAEVVSGPAHWLGWSLGASIVLALAGRQPERVRRLALMAGNPRFWGDSDWPGVERSRLEAFATDMLGNYRQTLSRFLGLQTFGLDDSRRVLDDLKQRMEAGPQPHPEALRKGLEILMNADLRSHLNELKHPLTLVLGGRDRLVPAELAEAVQSHSPRVPVHLLPRAAHLPFITEADACLRLLADFWG
ncbi:MAG: pimeloyl-ACP methyl ester esterase BioH [Methylococcaceae bacterium]|nr:pimeloyl-ACP methyl ester esterase BioH [Methylococcaceae bacterium]